jgi:choline monooxygenase
VSTTIAAELAARRDVPLDRARTLPGHWYADPDHHDLEMDRVFKRQWVGVGSADDVAAPGSYLATSVGGVVPVLVVRDDEGTLRAFLNVCRHRGSPLAEGAGCARALRCPYHGWIYRLDGSLVRATGVGAPADFDPAEAALFEVGVTAFARSLLVNLDPDATAFDPGPLAAAIDAYQLDEMEIGHRASHQCAFNWKVLLENYSENYHTPFIHPELPTAGWEYPIETGGLISFAWDRPLNPRDPGEEALRDCRPGGPGWERCVEAAKGTSFEAGSYVTLFPNTMLSAFADFAATLRVTPQGPTRCLLEREYMWRPGVPAEQRARDLEVTAVVVDQDLGICEAVQRSYTGGLSAHGALSTEHEQGVAHMHRLLVAALDDGA